MLTKAEAQRLIELPRMELIRKVQDRARGTSVIVKFDALSKMGKDELVNLLKLIEEGRLALRMARGMPLRIPRAVRRATASTGRH